MKYKLECQDGIQEGLETVRDLKSYNATNTYMEGLNKKIQAVEKHAVVSEAINAMFVCLSQLILKVGIGTTTLVGDTENRKLRCAFYAGYHSIFERAWWRYRHSGGIFRHDSRHHDSSSGKKKEAAVLYRSGKT